MSYKSDGLEVAGLERESGFVGRYLGFKGMHHFRAGPPDLFVQYLGRPPRPYVRTAEVHLRGGDQTPQLASYEAEVFLSIRRQGTL